MSAVFIARPRTEKCMICRVYSAQPLMSEITSWYLHCNQHPQRQISREGQMSSSRRQRLRNPQHISSFDFIPCIFIAVCSDENLCDFLLDAVYLHQRLSPVLLLFCQVWGEETLPDAVPCRRRPPGLWRHYYPFLVMLVPISEDRYLVAFQDRA